MKASFAKPFLDSISSFIKPYSTPIQIVQILGMYFSNKSKAENYLMTSVIAGVCLYFPFYKNPKNDLILKVGTAFEQAMMFSV